MYLTLASDACRVDRLGGARLHKHGLVLPLPLSALHCLATSFAFVRGAHGGARSRGREVDVCISEFGLCWCAELVMCPRRRPEVKSPMRRALLLSLLAIAAPFRAVRTTVSDGGGKVYIDLLPVAGGNGVLHLRLVGGRISRTAALRSIKATTKTIHKCNVCTVVCDMSACRGVSPLAIPVTVKFLLTHSELKQALIFGARGAVRIACLTVSKLAPGRLDLFGNFEEFERKSSRDTSAQRKAALQVARSLRPSSSFFGSRLDQMRALFEDAKPPQLRLPKMPWDIERK